MANLFIYGFPSLYGGAGTELHHQIIVWLDMGVSVNIIPTQAGYKNEPLYQEMIDSGVNIYREHQFSAVKPEDAIISFCCDLFLDNLGHIRQFTKRTIFVNCMTYLFDEERKCHERGEIAYSIYQREQVRDEHEAELTTKHGSKGEFLTFVPYFDASRFKFAVKDEPNVHIGRISRDSANKYTPFNGQIYDGIISPKPKVGHYLGYGRNAAAVCGRLPEWIKTYRDQTQLAVKDFYSIIDFIVQPTETKENWPRIGFEAAFSGKPLVVDRRDGWSHLIEHGVTGFLCNNHRDFMYYGSRLAYDTDLRLIIAENAHDRARDLSGFDRSDASWRGIFEKVFN